MAIRLSQLPIPPQPLQITDVLLGNASGITSQISLLSIQQAIQGAGFQLNAATPNNVVPIAQARADGLASTLGYVNVGMALVPKGAGPILGALPDNTAVGGNARGLNAVDWQTIRALSSQVAAAPDSTICGGKSNLINSAATDSTIGGGLLNSIISGTQGGIGAGNTNSVTGGQAPYIGGGQNNAILGGGNNMTISGGGSNVASVGSNVTIGGGFSNLANANDATISGGNNASVRGINGMHSYASGALNGVQGSAQMDDLALRLIINTATPTAVTSDQGGASNANQYTLANNSSALIYFEVVSRDVATGNSGAYSVVVLGKRGANAAATSIVGSPSVTALFQDAAYSGGGVTITPSADTVNGAIKLNFTGLAAVTTHTVCRVRAVFVI